MQADSLEIAQVYATFEKMGLAYGPAHRGITAVYLGENQLLAELRLPKLIGEGREVYVLHPSLMDGALQASVGLLMGHDRIPEKPLAPFVLQSLRLLSPCPNEMLAWVRYSVGSQAGDNVVRLDIDLCDRDGHMCVQICGFASRAIEADRTKANGHLLAVPVWQEIVTNRGIEANLPEWAEQHVILCELPKIDSQNCNRWLGAVGVRR